MVRLTWTGLNGQTYSIAFDATPRQGHQFPTDVTEHPVEQGSNITDNLRPEADQLHLEGLISNAPLFLPQDHIGTAQEVVINLEVTADGYNSRHEVRGAQRTLGTFGATNALSAIPVGVSDTATVGQDVEGRSLTAQVRGFSEPFDRVQAVYDEILQLRASRQLCTVITKRRTWENMAIANFEPNFEASTGDALAFVMDLKQVRFGSTRNEPLPLLPVKKKEKGTAAKVESKKRKRSVAFSFKELYGSNNRDDADAAVDAGGGGG